MCLIASNTTTCVASAFSSSSVVVQKFSKEGFDQRTSEDAVKQGMKLQTKVFLNVFALSGILLILSLLFESMEDP
jgi:hypothetical protein